jgi:hypothetical protein
MSQYVNSDGSQDHISHKYQDEPHDLQMDAAFVTTENPVPAKDEERGST